MLTREVAVNEFQLEIFAKTVADIPVDVMFQPGLGHGHPPIWILGHLAFCAELGQKLLGGELVHPEWMAIFGPRSSDVVAVTDSPSPDSLQAAVTNGYKEFRTMALSNADDRLLEPHQGFPTFVDSPIKTVADVIALLLTNHFGFHLAQLSSCRREAGHQPLF